MCCFFATLALAIATPQAASAAPYTAFATPQPASAPPTALATPPTANPPRHDTSGPNIEFLTSGNKISLRGLSVVSDKIVWVSGNSGTVGKSTDGGKTWNWMTVPGYEKRDFRDIEAFDSSTAIIMAIAEPADILKTTDGGKTWKLVYENTAKGMFLDAMEFWNSESGIIVGDPIDGRFFVTRSSDGGNSWHDLPYLERPKADSGEGCFASSGTNVRYLGPNETCFVSGGPTSHLFIRNKRVNMPILQGKTSTGANSVAVKDAAKLRGGQRLIVVGGDFIKDRNQEKNCLISTDGGKTWIQPNTPPNGYRSCVEFIGGSNVLCCGTNGVDFSFDDGLNWTQLTRTGFHVCRVAKKGKAVFLAGGDGRIAKLTF